MYSTVQVVVLIRIRRAESIRDISKLLIEEDL